MCIAILTIKTLNQKNIFCYWLILLNFLVPSSLYAFTGFEKIYEMRDQSYIKRLSLEFSKSANKEILNHKIDYYVDYTNIFYYINYHKYDTYLKNNYNNMSYFEFEDAFLKKESRIIK